MAKQVSHYCVGGGCGHSSHYEDGGEVKKSKATSLDPDPQRAKEAMAGANEGQSFSKGWNNLKNELGFGDSKQKAGYAKGGRVEYVPGEPEYGYRDKEAKGGEIEELKPMESSVDDELLDMCCEELCEAIDKKDKKGIIDAIKAIILNCME